MVLNEHQWPPYSFRINLISIRAFRCPLFPKQISCPRPFFATSYSKKALGPLPNFKTSIYQSQVVTRALCCTNALQKKKFKVGQKKEHLLLSFYNAWYNFWNSTAFNYICLAQWNIITNFRGYSPLLWIASSSFWHCSFSFYPLCSWSC